MCGHPGLGKSSTQGCGGVPVGVGIQAWAKQHPRVRGRTTLCGHPGLGKAAPKGAGTYQFYCCQNNPHGGVNVCTKCHGRRTRG
eukprot:366516-Chlamydomonas_euryale.AAC.4